MLYQKLLMGSKPYSIVMTRMNAFEMHRHPELEFLYCMEGTCNLTVNRQPFRLSGGDLLLVGSLVPHEILSGENHRLLVLEVGPVLLGEYFETLAKWDLKEPLLSQAHCPELHALFRETAEFFKKNQPFAELNVRGNIYKICASTLQMLMENAPSSASKRLTSVSNIEKALELIENSFTEPLDIDSVASVCGYGKSNFCRLFKNITGDTFHNALTRRRIQAAQTLLKETDASIENIALQTGFPDSKSLCRAFRRIARNTPGAYRHDARNPNDTSMALHYEKQKTP